jgi:hypothetical protein
MPKASKWTGFTGLLRMDRILSKAVFNPVNLEKSC